MKKNNNQPQPASFEVFKHFANKGNDNTMGVGAEVGLSNAEVDETVSQLEKYGIIEEVDMSSSTYFKSYKVHRDYYGYSWRETIANYYTLQGKLPF
ncbi:hypothetical protein [Natronorarus salvus]|uniref:hypothetical protein n=1 Tax=Natronorarus salvus TaxID=3117733 RepID=UPI002F26776F